MVNLPVDQFGLLKRGKEKVERKKRAIMISDCTTITLHDAAAIKHYPHFLNNCR